MNIAIVNGSPRKGNTVTAIEAFAKGAEGHDITIINADDLDISGCKGCGACQCHKGCIATDDTNPTVDTLVAADMIIFASPVYWWGVTAQMKLVIDKCYCRGAQIKGKQVGIILIGGASTENEQYDLIKAQFDCMGRYLGWNQIFFRKYSASGLKDLAVQTDALAELTALAQQL